jgi:hypothetical protein
MTAARNLAPPGNAAAPGGSKAEGSTAGDRAGRTTASIRAGSGGVAEPRWCGFTTTWCRCGAEHLESSTMVVCAAHHLHDSVEVV